MKKILLILVGLAFLGGVLFMLAQFDSLQSIFKPGSSGGATQTLTVGETKTIGGLEVTLNAVTEDSRCPIGVVCVWEGRLVAEVTLTTSDTQQKRALNLGEATPFSVFTIMLQSVEPAKVHDEEIDDSEYELTFTVTPREEITKKYSNSTYGIAFEYSSRYMVQEQKNDEEGRSHASIVLIEDTPENRAVLAGQSPGREGPVSITIDVYQDPVDSPTLTEWLKETPASNFTLSNGTFSNATLSGKPAVQYHWSGLYEADTIAAAYGHYIVAATVHYIAPEDSIRSVFDGVIKTFAFATSAPTDTLKSDLIRVVSPTRNALVKSPLIVQGEARGVWYFEASFPVILIGPGGKELAHVPATAKGEWMTENFVPFEGTLTFAAPSPGSVGMLVFKKDNPSGLPEHDDFIEIPVRF